MIPIIVFQCDIPRRGIAHASYRGIVSKNLLDYSTENIDDEMPKIPENLVALSSHQSYYSSSTSVKISSRHGLCMLTFWARSALEVNLLRCFPQIFFLLKTMILSSNLHLPTPGIDTSALIGVQTFLFMRLALWPLSILSDLETAVDSSGIWY